MPALPLIESFGLTDTRIIIGIAAALATLYYLQHDSRDYLGIPKSPTYTSSAAVAIVKRLLSDPENEDLGQAELQVMLNEKFRPLTWVRHTIFTGIAISSPFIIRDLLIEGQQQYREGYKITRAPSYTAFHQKIFSGPNIANVSGEEWKWRRRLMAPLFQPRKLVPQLLPYVVERTNELIELIKSSPNKDGLNIDSLLVFLTFDVICKYLFGKAGPRELDFSDIGGYEMTSKAMKDFVDGFGKSLPWTYLPLIGSTKWAHEPALTARTRIRNFVRTAILRCLASEDTEKGMESVVKIMATAPQFDTTTEEGLELLVSEVIVLLFAGHDTTAHTIAFAFGHIAQDHTIQSKILEEVHNIFGTNSIEPNNINAADLSKLTYTTAVLREVGRIYPIASTLTISTARDIQIAGYNIPANTILFAKLRACSMDPTVFAEPFNFDPSRWLLEESDAFMDLDGGESTKLPELNFSVGTHMCLGRNLAVLEMRTVVFMLVRQFEINFKKGFRMGITIPSLMKPRGGMWLTFKERI